MQSGVSAQKEDGITQESLLTPVITTITIIIVIIIIIIIINRNMAANKVQIVSQASWLLTFLLTVLLNEMRTVCKG